MANIKEAFGSSGQTITCSLAPSGVGLASGSARASTAIDNSSNLYLDALVTIVVKSGGSGTTSTGQVLVYAYGTANGTSNYTEGATGTDAAITLTSPTNARLIGVINVVATSTSYTGGPFSVAAAFGGVLPSSWGIIIQNLSGGALDTTEANHLKVYQGVYSTSV